jgi:hypothetical protein
MALAANGAVTGRGFNQQQPISLRMLQHDVGHLAMTIDLDAEPLPKLPIEVAPLPALVSGIDENAARHESRANSSMLASMS